MAASGLACVTNLSLLLSYVPTSYYIMLIIWVIGKLFADGDSFVFGFDNSFLG